MQSRAQSPQWCAALPEIARMYPALRKIFLAVPAASCRCSLAAKNATTIELGKTRANSARDAVFQRNRALTKPGETFGEIGIDLTGRIGHLLLSLWQKTLRTELLVVPERSRSCQSVATKPGVTARAAFPAALAVPLRISSGEHFRCRLITCDRGRGATSKVAQPSAIHPDTAPARACPGKPFAP